MHDIDKDQLKQHLPRYLEGRGIETDKAFQCLNPDHPDRHPSMRYDPRREAVHCFSCGVDYDLFDLVGIEYGLEGFAEQLAKVEEAINGPLQRSQKKQKPPASSDMGAATSRVQRSQKKQNPLASSEISAYIIGCHQRVNETDYFARRGIGPAVIEKFRLGYDPAFTRGTGGEAWQAVIIQTGADSFTARNIDPGADSRHRIRKQGESAFLGFQEALAPYSGSGGAAAISDEGFAGLEASSTRPETGSYSEAKSSTSSNTPSEISADIVCCEGEFDALSCWEVGQPAISLGSVANAGRFLRELEALFPGGEGAPALLLAMDNDEAGEKASAALLDALRGAGFAAYPAQVAGEHKDPNEALVANREGFAAALREASLLPQREREAAKKAYLSNSSAAHLAAFIGGIASSVDTEALGTGFAALDAQLDGGLYEGLYIFGAISSLGKTTLLLQMADQLAQQGQDVLIFSLEMARTELMAKSISRHTLEICLQERIGTGLAKTARGITTGKRYPSYSAVENDIITRAIQAYGAHAQHLFIHEGVGDIGAAHIRDTVRRHIDITGNRPVVLVDYLQILAPHSERATDKQNTDRAVLELKRISRDYKLPVLGISSFNRAGYGSAVTMESFKESGAIEYSSDVLIGLQLAGAGGSDFDVNAAKRENPRKVELILLKNRNGATGGKVGYKYYPLFNAFVEDAQRV